MNKTKGYIYAVTAQAFFVVWAIFASIAFRYYSIYTVTVLWFGFATLFGTSVIILRGNFKKYIKVFNQNKKYLLVSTFLDSICVLLSFYTLNLLGASLNSFLGKISILTIILFGIFLLKERFNIKELIGAIITLLGLILITFSTGDIVVLGIILIVIHSISNAISKTLIKSRLSSNNSFFLATYRATSVFFYSILFAIITDQFDFYWSYGILYATIPSVFTVLFGHVLIYNAYKHLELSKVSLINALGPFLTAITAYFVLGEVLSFRQWFGGIIIIIGITILSYFRNKD